MAGVRAAVAAAALALRESGARDEALAEFVPRRRAMLITREPVLRPIGRVWRLGVLLLDADGALRATGQLVRATPPGRTQYISLSAETRRAFRAAAERGHITPGDTVNFDAAPVDLSVEALRAGSGPLLLVDGRVRVRWNASASTADAIDVADYLRDRVDLLLNPPEGA